jgi:diguanylate cyclase (GGDEF)-like protein
MHRVNQLQWFNAPSCIPGAMILVWLVGGTVPRQNLIWFLSLAVLSTVLSTSLVVAHSWRYRRGLPLDRLERWRGPLLVFAGGVWGSPALLMSAPGHPEVFLVSMIFALGAASFHIVVTGPVKEYFYAFEVSLFGAATVGILVSDQPLRLGFAAAAITMLVMSSVLHRVVYNTLVEALVNRARAEEANDELLVANQRLVQQASHDALTGLSNRLHLLEHLGLLLEHIERAGQRLAVLFVDLDRFKVVNDSLGHAAGDELLRAVAGRVRRAAGPNSMLARLGGDEFIVVTHPVRDNHDATMIGERIRESLSQPLSVDGRELNITASIGVAMSSRDDKAEDLLRHADSALYLAKERGRNRIEVFDDALRSALWRRMDDEQDLRLAIASGQISPWFQPVVDLDSGAVVGAEVLARWLHPRHGVMPAGVFIAVAEDTGLIDSLSELVLGRAFATRAEWQRLGMDGDFRISVNVSPRQLTRADTPARLIAALERFECDPTGISVEVTETGLIDDLDHAAAQLDAIRALGVTVWLDDFGTGYSSLSLLQRLPLDGVKIDRSFISHVTTDRRDHAVVLALIGLVRELGLSVIAEGVETAEQVEMLRRLGCPLGQGYFWSPAVPSPDLPRLVLERSRVVEIVATS